MKTILVATLALGALALPATASAAVTGTGPIQPRQVVQDAAHLEFTLPSSYGQLVGALAGTPAIGTFRQELPSCNVDVFVGGRITANRPVKRGTRLRIPGASATQADLRLRRTVRDGDTTFYLGSPIGEQADPNLRDSVRGIAVMPAPRGLGTKRSRWLVVTASSALGFCSEEQVKTLTAGSLAKDVWGAVRTVKVADGKAAPPEGVKRVVA